MPRESVPALFGPPPWEFSLQIHILPSQWKDLMKCSGCKTCRGVQTSVERSLPTRTTSRRCQEERREIPEGTGPMERRLEQIQLLTFGIYTDICLCPILLWIDFT